MGGCCKPGLCQHAPGPSMYWFNLPVPLSCPSPQLSHSLQLHNPLAVVASVRRREEGRPLRVQSILGMAGSWQPAQGRMGSQETWVLVLFASSSLSDLV